MSDVKLRAKTPRLVSLDAYRGFVMLAMVSSGFAFASAIEQHPEILAAYDGSGWSAPWKGLWHTLAYQFSHVEWTGCSFWDLIQPSFMFMVGVALPFSFARRKAKGQSPWRRFGHVLFRSAVLVALGVFLSSNWGRQTNFTFVNVLSQIGLGYPFLYLLLGRRPAVQLAAIALILGGYWYYFYNYTIPPPEMETVTEHLEDVREKPSDEWTQFEGLAAHWNKHTNAAAGFDRWFLNQFPANEESWKAERFVVNDGGYQTLNFIPSLATMIFGLMAGQLLRGERAPKQKLLRLVTAGAACFVLAMAVDTTIWLARPAGWDWTLCPAVKRIWTPTWAVFSTGWAFWMLAGFYWLIDVVGWKKWSLPLVFVGMNSIAMYVMAQLLKPWVSKTLKIHLRTVDAVFDSRTVYYLFSDEYAYARIFERVVQLFVLWLVCVWLYRRRIFIRI